MAKRLCMPRGVLALVLVCLVAALSVGPVAAAPNGLFTDCSGTITAGTTAQNAIAVNTGLQYKFILNPASAVNGEALWISETGTATINGEASGSIALTPGSSYLWSAGMIPNNAISVNATTTAHKFTCSYA